MKARSHFKLRRDVLLSRSWLDGVEWDFVERADDAYRRSIAISGDDLAVGPRASEGECFHQDLIDVLTKRADGSLPPSRLLIGWIWVGPGQDPEYNVQEDEPSAHAERVLNAWLADQ